MDKTVNHVSKKYKITGTILLETGTHIGGSNENINIGGVDKLVIRNPIDNMPYLPGSSIKGKMRALLEGALNKSIMDSKAERHECLDNTCELCRLFGASAPQKKDTHVRGRILVRDANLTDDSKEKIKKYGTEIKGENAINRITAAANPRFIERVPAGVEFDFEIVYNAHEDVEKSKKDLANIRVALEMLEDDYLGGHGSRGYGKVKLNIGEPVQKDYTKK